MPSWWHHAMTFTFWSRSGGTGGLIVACRNWNFPVGPLWGFASGGTSVTQIHEAAGVMIFRVLRRKKNGVEGFVTPAGSGRSPAKLAAPTIWNRHRSFASKR